MNDLNWKANGIILEKYRLIKKYESRQGIFWKALDITNNIPKGIKISKGGLPGDKELIKYARETYISLLVPEHPNLSRFYSSIIYHRNIINIVEVVPGITLLDSYSKYPLSIREKISYIIQVIEALLHLNDTFKMYKDILEYESFYHGDLHSGNVIVTEDDRAVLIDWGQAYRVKEKSILYPTTAPEFHPLSDYSYYRGDRIDVFSLGVMIWNVFEGGIPFGSGPYLDNDGFGIESLRHNPINQAKRLDAVDKELYPIVKNMLHYNPAQRLSLDELLIFFKSLYKKYNQDERQNRFLYMKKRYSTGKTEISETANALFEISKIINRNADKEKLKAKILELSVRVITDNIDLFTPGELEAIREKYYRYLNREGLWDDISEEKDIFERNFYRIGKEDIDPIFSRLQDLVERYIYGEDIESIHACFLEFYKHSKLKHYYYPVLLEMISRFISVKKSLYHRLFNMLVYFYRKSHHKEFIFSFYDEYRRKSELKKEFDPVDLQVITLISNLLDYVLRGLKNFNMEKLNFLLILIKFTEWGYTKTTGETSYLKKYFYSLYKDYYAFICKNKTWITEDSGWSGVMVHYVSFILSYIECEMQRLRTGTFEKLIAKISYLLSISKTPYVDFELYRHFKAVYLALKENYKKERTNKSIAKLTFFSLKFAHILNDDFVRLIGILNCERKIEKNNIEIILSFPGVKDSKRLLEYVDLLKLSPSSKETIKLYFEQEYGLKPGVCFPGKGKDEIKNISLYQEDLFFNRIMASIDSGKIQKAKQDILSVLKDRELLRKNNIVRAFKFYVLLIELLLQKGSYYDAFIYLEELESNYPDFPDNIDSDSLDSIYKRIKSWFSGL
jgi:serine/threonine protein kinase